MVDLPLPDATPAPDLGDAAGHLVARVRAWHQRHPLARRIGAHEVLGLGVIALPYGAGAEGKSQALFHQPNLLPGLSHRALLQFAERHAVSYRPGPADWPLRQIERSDASEEAAPETRYLLTAAINDAHPRRALPHRLLIAPESPAIWGPRQWSRERLAMAALLLVAGLAVAAMGVRSLWRAPAAVVAPAPVAPASAMAASAVPSAIKVAVPASAPVPLPMTAPSAVAVKPVAASAPASSVATLPALAPSAANPVAAASVGPSAVPPPRLLPMPHQAKAAASVPAAPAAASASAPATLTTGTHYALVTAPAKKREDAEATLARVRKLLGPAIGTLQAQVMPSPEGYVVTIWPLPTEADAERLAEVLARRGVPMKWLEF